MLVHPLQVPLWTDLAAVVVGALAGSVIAARERYDVFGTLLLAVVMGLGGGIARDLLLGLRPVAITSRYYIPTVAVAAVAGLLFTSLVRRLRIVFTLLEALSDGLFTIAGVEKALLYSLPYASAAFVGVAAAITGGLLADVLGGRTVEAVKRGPWNATAALGGAVVYIVTAEVHSPDWVSRLAAFVVVVGMRLASAHWGLQTPAVPDVGEKIAPRAGVLPSAGRRADRPPGDGDGDGEAAGDSPPAGTDPRSGDEPGG
ncbi:MAG TPA: TRIC cation channel family protein [Trebonia sp.]|jgi:uncharacterized membrane protein YeiH